MSPEELVAHAKAVELSGLSITDHDNVNAYSSAVEAARSMGGIWIGTGVEFSSVNEGKSVHVLGYDFDPEAASLQAFCKRHVMRRRERNRAIIDKLGACKMPIDRDQLEKLLSEGVPVGRPHIALAMVEKGYVKTVEEAFDHFLGDRRPCFDPGIPISTDETLAIIHKAGGKAFIAHPHFMRNAKAVEKLLTKPFDGIECYYGRLAAEQEKQWVALASERGLLISGGSDFHGAIKPNIPLGCSWVDEETFDRIFERHRWKFA